MKTAISLMQVLKGLEFISPVKITFNNIVLYNDYDSNVEIVPGVLGEIAPPIEALSERLPRIADYLITDISISIVDSHHSLLNLSGYLHTV